jgi:uncharacterized protein (DUF2147 family)
VVRHRRGWPDGARSTLTTSGCIAGGLICKSANWKRVP